MVSSKISALDLSESNISMIKKKSIFIHINPFVGEKCTNLGFCWVLISSKIKRFW